MSSSPTKITFAEATSVKQISSHTYGIEFSRDWMIGEVPHGGYVTAIFLRVAELHFSTTLSSQNQPHPIALHLDFLRRTSAGAALFTVKDVKFGRQTTVIHITLTQGPSSSPREEIVGYITHSNTDTEEGFSVEDTKWTLNPPIAKVDLKALAKDEDKLWARQKHMPFSKFRMAQQRLEFSYPRGGQIRRNIGDEWIRLSSGENFTTAALGFVVDMWPMPIEAFLHEVSPYDVSEAGAKEAKKSPARFWYPTLLLNMDFKKPLPEEGVEWLCVRVETKKIKNGRSDIDVIVLDETGDIVALSQHVALVVPSERNVAKRSSGAVESKI